MKKIIIINGPNLNLLGNREETIYGTDTLEDIKKMCLIKSDEINLKIDFFKVIVRVKSLNIFI